MLLQFRTKDDAIWILDTQHMKWARVSEPPDPTNDEKSIVQEFGALVPQGFGVYALEGRRPDTEGPGAGFCTAGVFVVGLGQTVEIYVRANVEVKDFTMPLPINHVSYKILPSDPNQIKQTLFKTSEEIPPIQKGAVAHISGTGKKYDGDFVVVEASTVGGDVNSSSNSLGNLDESAGAQSAAAAGQASGTDGGTAQANGGVA